jgi:hypothetical protein
MRIYINEQKQGSQTSSQFAGKAVYFFDISVLRSSVASLIGWSTEKLEAAIAPRVEHAISDADLWLTTPLGFFVIFANPDPTLACNQAKSICVDILKHFYGQEEYPPEYVDKLCRPSSTFDLEQAGVVNATGTAKSAPPPKRRPSDEDDTVEAKQEQFLFRQKCIDLFRDHLNSSTEGLFQFSPCWDSKRDRITSFACGEFETLTSRGLFESCGIVAAMAQCELDVMALAAATRGVLHIRSRGDVAFVNVPVHCETLAWSRTRWAYLAVLSQIEPSLLPFLSPRINGVHEGYNVYATGPWITELRHYVRWAFVHLPNLNFELSKAPALCLTGFGIELASMRPAGVSSQVLREEAQKLVGICTTQKAIACVDGVESVADLLLLKGCGIWIISGPVVGQSSGLPGPIKSLSFPATSARRALSGAVN